MADWCVQAGADVLLRVKVVPGASRDAIAGLLGDRLKIRVAAPPEDGKANAALLRFLAQKLGVRESQLEIVAGHGAPRKLVAVTGLSPADVEARLVTD